LDEFRRDPLRIDATIRQLEVLGEAAARVSDKFRAEHPEIHWREAVGTRNVLIHDYASVLPDVVWKTVREDLPVLVEALDSILEA